MSAPILTKDIVRAASMDAGNASMRRHGRKVWNLDDRNAATDKQVELMRMLEPDNPTWFIEI
jgi:hypothetical protein